LTISDQKKLPLDAAASDQIVDMKLVGQERTAQWFYDDSLAKNHAIFL